MLTVAITQSTASVITEIVGRNIDNKKMTVTIIRIRKIGKFKNITGDKLAIAPNQYKTPFFIIKLLFKQNC